MKYKAGFGPMLPEVSHLPFDNPYRAGDPLAAARVQDVRPRPLLRRHGRHAVVIGRARRVGVAVKLDVAAHRNGGETPARAALVDSRPEFRTESQREGVYLHPTPPSGQVMAELVEEDDGGH